MKEIQTLHMTAKIVKNITVSVPESISDLTKHIPVRLEWISNHNGFPKNNTTDMKANTEHIHMNLRWKIFSEYSFAVGN